MRVSNGTRLNRTKRSGGQDYFEPVAFKTDVGSFLYLFTPAAENFLQDSGISLRQLQGQHMEKMEDLLGLYGNSIATKVVPGIENKLVFCATYSELGMVPPLGPDQYQAHYREKPQRSSHYREHNATRTEVVPGLERLVRTSLH
jgi:hypothetical protein